MIRFNPSWKPMSNWIIFPPATETGDDTSLFFLRFSDRRNFHLSESFPRNSPHHPSPSSTFFGFFRTFQTLTSARATPLVKTPKEIRLGSLCLCVCVQVFLGGKLPSGLGTVGMKIFLARMLSFTMKCTIQSDANKNKWGGFPAPSG